MNKSAVLAVAAAAAISATASPAAAAPSGMPVQIVAHTSFSSEVSAFESSLPGCEAGTVVNGDVFLNQTPWGGVFSGSKVFSCGDDESGFVIRLRARFGADGSSGSWSLVDGWGELDGIDGSGSLVGIPTPDGIDDVYTGSVR